MLHCVSVRSRNAAVYTFVTVIVKRRAMALLTVSIGCASAMAMSTLAVLGIAEYGRSRF